MRDGTPEDETAGRQRVLAVLDWVDYSGDRGEVVGLLTKYREWLATEAITAGGIGPAETKRLWHRHLADSLTFLAGLGGETTVVDVGSGVGLPGIPLAIALPHTSFTLLDRSERRCDLASRAVRVLGLANVEVVQGDAVHLTLPHEAAVSRAVSAPEDSVEFLRRLLPNGTVAVVGGSHGGGEPPEGLEIIRVPTPILGEAVWLVKLSLSV